MVNEDYEQKWSEVLTKLIDELREDEQEYENWFKNIKFVSLSDEAERTLTVSVSELFLRNFIEKYFLELLQDIAKEVYGPLRRVQVKLRAMGVPAKQTPPPPKPEEPKPQRAARKLDAERARRLMYNHTHVKPPSPAPRKPNPAPLEEPESELETLSPEALERLEALWSPRKDKGVRVDDIRQAVCRHYSVSEDDIASGSRGPRLTEARQVGMYLACTLTNVSTNVIGGTFGRERTTVIYSKRIVEQGIKIDKGLKDSVLCLSHELKNKK